MRRFTKIIAKTKTKKKKKKELIVFEGGYQYNDLFTIKHNYVSINKMELRKNRKQRHSE